MIKGVFFDFNGTLYFDQDINRITWKQTIDAISDGTIDFDSFYIKYGSVMDKIVISDAFKMINKSYTEEEIEYWTNYKENAYRQYGIDHSRTVLAPGAKKLLDYLKNKNIPVILCTSSIIENVQYYFDYFDLYNWFDFKQTVYDNGSYISKAEMYKECASRLNIDIKEAVVFEDSPRSINEAIKGGVNKIVAIKRDNTPIISEIKQIINDYTELDYSIFD